MSLPAGRFIFVSYSNQDRDFVHPEITRLEGLGFPVWYDKGRLQPGRVWNEEIRHAVADCACFLMFITQDAVNSRNVRREVRHALKTRKPFVCVYLAKVELPPRYHRRIKELMRRVQALERYELFRYEYEEPLSRALAEYLKIAPRPGEKNVREEKVNVPPLPGGRADVLPKIFFSALVLSGAVFFFLALVATIAPHFASASPNDPLNNRPMGIIAGIFFTAVALSLEAGAFVVYRVYLRRKHG